MLGKIVKIILSIEAIIGLIFGILIIVTPALITDTGVTIDGSGIFILGIVVIGWHGLILAGLTRLHER